MTWMDGVLLAALIFTGYWLYGGVIRRRGLATIDATLEHAELRLLTQPMAKKPSRLRSWLSLAGYRRASAPDRFVGAQAAATVLGLLVAWAFFRSGFVEQMSQILTLVPGAAGEFFVMVAGIGPWIAFLLIASVPVLIVRAARRERVAQVERDLPLMLDLFATLAEAGLGFDSALQRILSSQPPQRALPAEFGLYQQETLAGVPRSEALRRLARRVGLGSVTTFVSAVVEAEEIGASLAETLRHQSEDMRDRRRARTMLLAQALPVKLVFPLVICFLPGIFASTLAPALYQMIKVVDSVLPGR